MKEEKKMRAALRFWRFGMGWYRLTQRLTGRRGDPVPVAASIEEVAARLSFGNAYKPDPWGGKLDILRHPRLVQRWINEGKKVGDCDEHAAYWCCVLLKSQLVAEAWFCTIQMIDLGTGDGAGHAFCVFRRTSGGPLEWIDYNAPTACPDGWRQVMRSVAAAYGSRPVGMTLLEVGHVREDDSLALNVKSGDLIMEDGSNA